MVEARPQSHSFMNSLTSSTSWYKKTASLSLLHYARLQTRQLDSPILQSSLGFTH